MNKHRQDWINALRSGEWKQGQGYLKQIRREKSEYCCLGVACVMAGVELDEIGLRGDFGLWDQDREGIYGDKIPQWLMEVLELTERELHQVVFLNDTYYNFDDIADYLEGNFTKDRLTPEIAKNWDHPDWGIGIMST
jgi:hypothetical protein